MSLDFCLSKSYFSDGSQNLTSTTKKSIFKFSRQKNSFLIHSHSSSQPLPMFTHVFIDIHLKKRRLKYVFPQSIFLWVTDVEFAFIKTLLSHHNSLVTFVREFLLHSGWYEQVLNWTTYCKVHKKYILKYLYLLYIFACSLLSYSHYCKKVC